jgi:hypothetical protein
MDFLKVNKWYSFGLFVSVLSVIIGFLGLAYHKAYESLLTIFGSSYAEPYFFLIIGVVGIFIIPKLINHHMRVKKILAKKDARRTHDSTSAGMSTSTK